MGRKNQALLMVSSQNLFMADICGYTIYIYVMRFYDQHLLTLKDMLLYFSLCATSQVLLHFILPIQRCHLLGNGLTRVLFLLHRDELTHGV